MILYEKFGYQIKLLNKKYGIDMFKLLYETFVSEDSNVETISQDRAKLKGKISFVLESKNYNPIGLFINDKLIGISFSSIVVGENTPWLGYFFINKEYRGTKGGLVLINYIVNHLYKGQRIQLGPGDSTNYSKLIKVLPLVLGFAVMKDDTPERLLRLCGEDK